MSVEPEGDSTRVAFARPAALARFVAPKGSVALNGASLTVNEVEGASSASTSFRIPEAHTTWGDVRVGDLRQSRDRHARALRRAAGRGRRCRLEADPALAFPPGTRRISLNDSPISSIEEIIEDARNGRMFILVDHEDRENEGDLVIPAQMCTPNAINFMATHGRGLICLTLTGERLDALGLPLMAAVELVAGTRRPSPSRSRRARA